MSRQKSLLFNETKLLFVILTSLMLSSSFVYPFVNLESTASHQMFQLPKIYDINLNAEIFFKGLNFPTSFAFLGPDDILVLEKNTGQVRRIVNGSVLPDPLLDVNVSKQSERGMLGIAVGNKKNENIEGRSTTTDVFLYFTESTSEGKDNQTLGNRLYKYQLIDNRLVNPKMLLDLPSSPGPAHNGGRVKIGPDNNVYLTVGNLNDKEKEHFLTRAENLEKGLRPDGRAGILRVTQDGTPIPNGSLIGDEYPLNLYYAYGIRNSFGMDFDPLTGNLWDTENGPSYGDEINLVQPGFNSGWNKVQGIWERNDGSIGGAIRDPQEKDILVDFNGKGNYSSPEFVWKKPVAPTAIKFLNSDKLGKEYENDMFVGDFRNGNIYHFDLRSDRKALDLVGHLQGKIVNNPDELKTQLFGQGFGVITDIEVGPDGYLYVLVPYQTINDCSPDNKGKRCVPYSAKSEGTIYRIAPKNVTGT